MKAQVRDYRVEGGEGVTADLEAVTKTFLSLMHNDLREATRSLSDKEARYLVHAYYQTQENRKRSAHQERKLVEANEPHTIMPWLVHVDMNLEAMLQNALGNYANTTVVGRWSRSIVGIGPVLAAGVLAHCGGYIEHMQTVGQLWRFAGLDPTTKWEKGKKRPWNADLKVIAWKIGESFVYVSNHKDDVYGHIYAERKILEQERNEAGLFADQAANALAAKRYKADTVAYQWYAKGKLPPAHIHARATRYAAKLYLSHWHHVAYEAHHGVPPPKPYILTQPGHAHYVAPPHWPMA